MTGNGDIKARANEVLAQAAALPSLEEVRDLAGRAVRHGGTREMSLDEIRALGEEAVGRAEQVTDLLGRLSLLLAEDALGGEP